MRSPILSVGSIEAEGMKNVWTTNVRMPNATRKAMARTVPHSAASRQPRRRRGTVTSVTSSPGSVLVDVGEAMNGLVLRRGGAITTRLRAPFDVVVVAGRAGA